jgi:hypothetical protein
MISPFSRLKTADDVAPFLDDDNKLVYPLCDNTILIIHKCLNLDPNQYIVYDKNQATIAGLFFKQVKLFEEFYNAYKEDKLYLCFIFQRIIYEAFIKMKYLIKYGKEAQITYRSHSYKNRYKFSETYKSSENGYFKVRNDKYESDIAEDGFTIDDIKNSKNSFGGKNLSQLIEEFDDKAVYSSLYGIASDAIHSDWGEIRQIYLQKTPNKNQYIIPDSISMKEPYRYLIPMLDIINDSSTSFIDWFLSIDSHFKALKAYKKMLEEFNRVSCIIMLNVFKEYEQNPTKYMYE